MVKNRNGHQSLKVYIKTIVVEWQRVVAEPAEAHQACIVIRALNLSDQNLLLNSPRIDKLP